MARESTSLRICVTGGRDFKNWELLNHVLDLLNPTEIGVGDCHTGVDQMTRWWSYTNLNQSARCEFVADWGLLGMNAGPIRNQRMLSDFKPDLLLAFPGGKGTADCKAKALKMGIPVLEVILPGSRREPYGQE
jgi:hypothetical protein